jgi:hypothetical protein
MLMPLCCVPLHSPLVEKVIPMMVKRNFNLYVLSNLTSTTRVVHVLISRFLQVECMRFS